MKDIKVPLLPRMSSDEFKEIAEKFLKQNNFFRNIVPVNVEILAFNTEHPVETFQELRNEFDCKGTAWFNKEKDRFEIYIDSYHYQYQIKSSQFTIAEELAHIIIHADIFKQIESPEDRLSLDKNTSESTHQVIEKQAKQLASELLLPTAIFYPYATDWIKINLKNILAERPANERDLLNYINKRIGDKLDLSEFIINRALTRRFDEPLIPKLVQELGIKYLEDAPRIPMKSKYNS